MSHVSPAELNDYANGIRRLILEQSKRANVGHIGSALSIADVVAALYGGVLDPGPRDDPDRDRFILSKGHAALAVYAALHLIGSLDRAELDTYCGDATHVGVHPEHQLAGIDFSTGSLGHGLSIGVGAALAGWISRSRRRVFVVLSDAECNEGSVWEGAMFAGHHRLANLTAIVDMNGQQALGYTSEVIDAAAMSDRWRAFGWHVDEIDGHDPAGIVATINRAASEPAQPSVILARTVFGKGVSFMESRIEWHYLPMSDAQYAEAMDEIGAVP